ncbi:MAG: FAD-dependent oxidoreductase [Ardenticatenaceae bacterium]
MVGNRSGAAFRVAIIGAGIAGCAAAYFVRESMPQAEIVVFEKAGQVGGRIRSMQMGGLLLDSGATLIHSSNRHLVHFLKVLGLKKALPHHRKATDPPSTVGVWNGTSFDLLTSRSSWRTQIKMLQRYHLSPLRLQRVVKQTVKQWTQIYELQAQQEGFASPKALFRRLGLYELTQESSGDFLERQGVASLLVQEFVTGISRVNYGQDASINSFVNMVSLAGAGLAGGHLFSVAGGNVQLCQGLLAEAKVALHMNMGISAIGRDNNTKSGIRPYILTTSEGREKRVDAVIIAAPLEFAHLRFNRLEIPRMTYQERPYQVTNATFVMGELNPAYFGQERLDKLPDLIMTREAPNIPFSSIGVAGSREHSSPIYKIFSRQPISDDLLAKLFTKPQQVERILWWAYPILNPMPEWPPFKLADGLYYANAMESAVSTMETEAVASRNVVNLLLQDLKN